MRPTEFARSLARFQVTSIGAAGTFVARRPGPEGALAGAIARAIPHSTEVMFLAAPTLSAILRPRGPEWDAPAEGTKRFITLLSASPVHRPSLPILEPDSTAWVLQIADRVGHVVLSLRRRTGPPGLHYPNPAVEKAFGVPATTRGWETILAVARVSGSGPKSDAA
ncbi:MAG: hypothetical protein L3K08_01185 [Thermoplasmata archaeon]|nr:hypothetical protein [Thermoplasmata archaeon]